MWKTPVKGKNTICRGRVPKPSTCCGALPPGYNAYFAFAAARYRRRPAGALGEITAPDPSVCAFDAVYTPVRVAQTCSLCSLHESHLRTPARRRRYNAAHPLALKNSSTLALWNAGKPVENSARIWFGGQLGYVEARHSITGTGVRWRTGLRFFIKRSISRTTRAPK